MQTKIIQYNHGRTPSFDSKLPAGTEIYINKVPWDWHIHVRVSLRDSFWNVFILNAEIPEGEYNPNMEDFYKLDWFDENFDTLEEFKGRFEFLGIAVPNDFLSKLKECKKAPLSEEAAFGNSSSCNPVENHIKDEN